MKHIAIRSFTLTALALPLAFGLAACKKQEGTNATAPSGAPVANIAPPTGKAWSDMVEETADGGMRMGNPTAPIRLVEYGSLSCPHCAKLAEEGYASLVKDYVATGRVSYEYRSFAIHPQDVPLTVLVRCASKEAFFPLVDQIYANFDAMNAPLADKAVQDRAQAATQLPPQQRMLALADALGYTQFFAQRGVSLDQAKACLADTANAQRVADFANKYSAAGIEGTPTLFINDGKVDGAEWPALEQALRAAGAR